MNKLNIYYKDQCNYCLNKSKCSYERRTRRFIDTISGIESLATGVYGCLSFNCDYFSVNQAVYTKANMTETAVEV